MEGLKLGDLEQAYYAELFQTCDVEGTGKITGMKASELFLASSLHQDALKQIWELCGAKRLGHFGRSQFYIALKLIAVAQNNLPIKLETLNSGIDIPLPKFSSKCSDQGDRKRVTLEGEAMPGDGKGPASGALPPPPAAKQSHRRSLSGQYRGVVPDGSASFSTTPQQSTQRDDSPHNSKSPAFSPKQSPPTSPNHAPPRTMMRQHTAPAAYSNSSLSMDIIHDTGHVNPVALASNNIGGGGGGGGPGGGGGGGGIVNPALSAAVSVGNGPSAGPGTAHHNSSNENGNWAMFEEDENHMLIGSGVKKWESSLEPAGVDSSSISSEAESVDDVWTITDEQRDYYIKQFLTMQPDLAKHITGPVAKNFFEKSKLPVVELSKIWQLSDLNRDGALSVEEFCIAMHLVVLRRNDVDLPDHLPVSLMPYSTLSDEPFAADLPPGSTLKRATPPSPVENKWKANFVQESPGSSGVPSPAHLVNFDYAKPSADPDLKIVHPVAVRASPDNHPLPPEGFDRGRALSGSSVLPPAVPPRVQPKETPLLQKASESGATAECKGLPKRLVRANIMKHRRSASLGLLKMSAISSSEPSIEGAGGGSVAGPPVEQQELTTGGGEDNTDNTSKETISQPLAQRQMSRDKRDIGMAIRTHKERNAMLTRLNSELNQELQEVMEQRIALEIQLEHLRPFSS